MGNHVPRMLEGGAGMKERNEVKTLSSNAVVGRMVASIVATNLERAARGQGPRAARSIQAVRVSVRRPWIQSE
jgi:hypothetical protein